MLLLSRNKPSFIILLLRGEMRRTLENWRNMTGQYVLYDDNSDNMRHDVLNTK